MRWKEEKGKRCTDGWGMHCGERGKMEGPETAEWGGYGRRCWNRAWTVEDPNPFKENKRVI